MKTINRLEAADLLKRQGGLIFGASFIKKDGTRRKIVCRFHVQAGTNGVGLAFDPYRKGLLPVYDLNLREHRFLNFRTLRALAVQGQSYRIKGGA